MHVSVEMGQQETFGIPVLNNTNVCDLKCSPSGSRKSTFLLYNNTVDNYNFLVFIVPPAGLEC